MIRLRLTILTPPSFALLLSLAWVSACAPDHSPTAADALVPHLGAIVVSEDAFSDLTTVPFGSFGGVDYVRHVGRFAGTTELGAFDMPFEVVAPADGTQGSGELLLEPPHFAFGAAGRELVLGRQLVFGGGAAYAAVGFGSNGLNVLHPSPPGGPPRLADATVAAPGMIDPGGVVDEEILIQFVLGLTTTLIGDEMIGSIERTYAYGLSQTAGVLLETLHHPQAQALFDFTLLHLALWRPAFEPPDVLDRLPSAFDPLDGIGRVAFVESEGDLLVSEAMQFRRATSRPSYRVYEVAGTSHQPTPLNPLDHGLIARAVFAGGLAWAAGGAELPPSRTLALGPTGADDPVYGFETGILRDADLNALGGVRLPEIEIGTARFIASDFTFDPAPPLGLFGLVGAMVDLTCERRPGEPGPRFPNHGAFMRGFAGQANALVADGLLLPGDAESIKTAAGASGVGKPRRCS